ncbi:MAG: ester cyclase [Ktedonobacterales bacterium]|nr:ester cyclase [Ktedonobacterales bacterium]
MTDQTIRQILEDYAQGQDAQTALAEDAILLVQALPQPLQGRAAIEGLMRLFYHEAFAEARNDPLSIAADEARGLGFLEFTFRGRHIGELMGIAPTGREVALPMMGVYEISEGQIHRARLYYDNVTLLRQLGQIE